MALILRRWTSALTQTSSGSNDPGNPLQVRGNLDIGPVRQKLSNLLFRGKSDLANEPAAWLERGVGLRNKAAIDVHAFLPGEDRDFGFELSNLLLYFVSLGWRIRNY